MIELRRMGALGVAGLVAVVVGGVSCGGGGGGGDGSVAASGTPVDLCKKFVTTLCSRLNDCAGLDASVQDQMDCVTVENVEFGCDRATSAGFPTCLSDVKLLSCSALFSPDGIVSTPASCDEPLNTIPLSDAQMKCAMLGHVVCQKILACDGTPHTADDLASCDQEAFFALRCNIAIDVGPTYTQCLSDFPNSMCAAGDGGADGGGGAIPSVASCSSVIKVAQ